MDVQCCLRRSPKSRGAPRRRSFVGAEKNSRKSYGLSAPYTARERLVGAKIDGRRNAKGKAIKRRGHDRSAAYGNRKQTRYPTQKPQKKSGKPEGSERVRGGQAQKPGTRSIGQNSTSTSIKDGLGRAVRASRESCPTARYPFAWDKEQTKKTGGHPECVHGNRAQKHDTRSIGRPENQGKSTGE